MGKRHMHPAEYADDCKRLQPDFIAVQKSPADSAAFVSL